MRRDDIRLMAAGVPDSVGAAWFSVLSGWVSICVPNRTTSGTRRQTRWGCRLAVGVGVGDVEGDGAGGLLDKGGEFGGRHRRLPGRAGCRTGLPIATCGGGAVIVVVT